MDLKHRLGVALIGTTLFAAAGIAAIAYPSGEPPARGAAVITFNQVVAGDVRSVPQTGLTPSEPGPENPFFVPTYSTEGVEAEIDLWHKRLTYKTRNEPRR